MTTKKKI